MLTTNGYARGIFLFVTNPVAVTTETFAVGHSLIDNNKRALTAQIFESSLPLSEKIQLRRLLDMIVCISDNIEDAADELELVSLKSIV